MYLQSDTLDPLPKLRDRAILEMIPNLGSNFVQSAAPKGNKRGTILNLLIKEPMNSGLNIIWLV